MHPHDDYADKELPPLCWPTTPGLLVAVSLVIAAFGSLLLLAISGK